MNDLRDYAARLERLRAKRLAEDDLLVCMERARILQATRETDTSGRASITEMRRHEGTLHA